MLLLRLPPPARLALTSGEIQTAQPFTERTPALSPPAVAG
jgi:hypothetical protein